MSILTANPERAALEALLDGERTDEFLTRVGSYLESCPEDHAVRLAAVREYVKLGLIGPGRELLDPALGSELPEDRTSHGGHRGHGEIDSGGPEAGAEAVSFPPEFASVRRQLESLPSGQVPWETHAERFEANLQALAERRIDAASLKQAWVAASGRFELYQDNRGLPQVRARDENGAWRWFPLLGDTQAIDASRPVPDAIQQKQSFPAPVLFDGWDLGGFFERVYHASRNTFLTYSCALFVVEPDAARFAVPLHLNDWGEVLSDPRVLLFVGNDWEARLARAFADDVDLPWPSQAIRSLTASEYALCPAVEVINHAVQIRQRQVEKSRREVERQYAERDIAHWARRFDEALSGRRPELVARAAGPGAPLRILSAVSSHTTFLQYSVRDAKRALEALGHQCVVLTEKNTYSTTSPLTYHRAMRELDPDIFLILDHLRPEFAGIVPANLPILTWDQDMLPHVFTPQNMRAVAEHDFVVGCSKSPWVQAGCNPRQFLHAQVPTCPEAFGGEPLTDEEQARYGCDVSYVSHASQTPAAFHDEERRQCQDANGRKLLDTIYELLPAALAKEPVAHGHLAASVLDEAARRCGVAVADPAAGSRLRCWYIWRLADRIFRHQALEWVADWARGGSRTFRIYGRGWDAHPTLAEFAAGPVENGRELLCVYRASRINLQLMPAGFVHQRALDGLAADGFFLTRLAPQDLRGRTLRKLANRIDELGIKTQRELCECRDVTLQALLKEYLGRWGHCCTPESEEVLQNIQAASELLFPDEVFPEFEAIVFDTAASFAAAADRFLGDSDLRGRVTQAMRQVVIERFSYRPTMDRFLRAMGAYLDARAAAAHSTPRRITTRPTEPAGRS